MHFLYSATVTVWSDIIAGFGLMLTPILLTVYLLRFSETFSVRLPWWRLFEVGFIVASFNGLVLGIFFSDKSNNWLSVVLSMIYFILFWILILLTQIIYLSAWSFWHLTIGISCAYYADKTCHWFPAIDNNPLVPPENYTHMYTGISY